MNNIVLLLMSQKSKLQLYGVTYFVTDWGETYIRFRRVWDDIRSKRGLADLSRAPYAPPSTPRVWGKCVKAWHALGGENR